MVVTWGFGFWYDTCINEEPASSNIASRSQRQQRKRRHGVVTMTMTATTTTRRWHIFDDVAFVLTSRERLKKGMGAARIKVLFFDAVFFLLRRRLFCARKRRNDDFLELRLSFLVGCKNSWKTEKDEKSFINPSTYKRIRLQGNSLHTFSALP